MLGNCKDCKHWAEVQEYYDVDDRRCDAANRFYPFLFHAYAEPDHAGWRTSAYLLTNENFGCIHWEQKEKENA